MQHGPLPVDREPEEARPPRSGIPKGATDCHFHIFGPRDRYPLSPLRVYEPVEASLEAYQRVAKALGIERAVVVTGSPHGGDNRCTLDAMARLGMPARGVAVVSPDISGKELEYLQARGIRGIRLNFITGRTPLADLPAIAARIKPFGMHVQLWMRSESYDSVLGMIDRIGLPVVIDHMGQIPASWGMDHPHFHTLVTLLETGQVWIKLIGYRISRGPPYLDLVEPAREILRAAEDRCVWGTDWPHPFLEGRPMPNDGELLDLLASWCTQAQLQKVLVDNPARLYGF